MQDFWSPLQEKIKQLCSDYDKSWQIRKRKIDTHFLALFIFKLVLSKNHQGYKSLLSEIWERSEELLYPPKPISASSICEARQKLPEELFMQLNQLVISAQEEQLYGSDWRGHRIFAIDGSKIHLPHELLTAGYKAPNKHQYYPQGLLSTVYRLGTGLIYDCMLSANKSERHCAIAHMKQLSQDDVLVLDRGYFSYLMLYQAMEHGLHLICRLQTGSMNRDVSTFWESNLEDTVIEYHPSDAVKSQLKRQGYQLNYKPIPLRLLKYTIGSTTYLCGTTLIGKAYPINEFPRVYHGRWGIEELYKISKEFIDVEDFHGRTERGVKQELFAHVVLNNIARLFESEANKQLPPSGPTRRITDRAKESYWQDFCDKLCHMKVNFKNCLLVLGRFIEKLIHTVIENTASWLSVMLASISRVRQKIRPGRRYTRRSRKPYSRWKSSNLSKLAKTSA